MQHSLHDLLFRVEGTFEVDHAGMGFSLNPEPSPQWLLNPSWRVADKQEKKMEPSPGLVPVNF